MVTGATASPQPDTTPTIGAPAIVNAVQVPGEENVIMVGNRRYARVSTATNMMALTIAGLMTLSGTTAATTGLVRDMAFAASAIPIRSVEIGAHPMQHETMECAAATNLSNLQNPHESVWCIKGASVTYTRTGDTVTVVGVEAPMPGDNDTFVSIKFADGSTRETQMSSLQRPTIASTICMLTSDDFRRAAKCLDSGCSHHLFSEQYVTDNPSLFQNATSAEVTSMPTSIGNWQGTSAKVIRYVWYTDMWPTDRGMRNVKLGPCIVSGSATMNLLSEELVVQQLNISTIFRNDGRGKYMEFQDGAKTYLKHHQHLQYVPDELQQSYRAPDWKINATPTDDDSTVNASSTRAPDATPIPTADRDKAWNLHKCFIKDRFTIHDGAGGEIPPSEDLLRNCEIAHTADMDDKCNTEHTAWTSTAWRKFSACFGFRDKTKLVKAAKSAGIKLAARDMRHCEAGLKGNARLKPDPPSTERTKWKVGDCLAQDPVPLPCTGYGNKNVVFFTADMMTGKVEVFPAENKSSSSAIDATTEYVRSSPAYRNRGQKMPLVFKSDSESIYTSAQFFA